MACACPQSRFAEADAQRWRLVTTNAVVIETHALLVARLRDGRRHGIEFLDRMERTELRVERLKGELGGLDRQARRVDGRYHHHLS